MAAFIDETIVLSMVAFSGVVSCAPTVNGMDAMGLVTLLTRRVVTVKFDGGNVTLSLGM